MSSQKEAKGNKGRLLALQRCSRVDPMEAARRTMYKLAAGPFGATCPCCERYIKVYRRTFSSDMARCLILLVRNGDRWTDIKQLPVRGGDYAKALHWGVVETQGGDSGLWRPTARGLDFVNNRTRIPSCVFLLKNVCIDEGDDLITIREALGDAFDYFVLMGQV